MPIAVDSALRFRTRSHIGCWFGIVSTFSCWPLLRRDGLALAYVSCILAHVALWIKFGAIDAWRADQSWFMRWWMAASTIAMAGAHACEVFVPPPTRYPDLYPVIMVAISCLSFLITWVKVTGELQSTTKTKDA